MRRVGARGNTTASRVKTLVLHAEARHGRAAADHLLGAIRLDRDYLEDESRALSREVWHAALEAFASRYGRGEIRRITPSVVHPENLGVWTRVLRGASSVRAAFLQLDQAGGEEVMTERWVSVDSTPTSWRGVVPIHPESELERDGLLCLARAAELAAIPLLFGQPPARVDVRGDMQALVIDVDARWQPEPAPRWALGLGAGAAPAGLASLGLGLPLAAGLGATVGGALVGGLASAAIASERRRRAAEAQQLHRIGVLERASTLRDARERQAQVFREGSMVAGQYRLQKRLGAGGIGTIWEATRASDGEVVALKLLKAAVAHDSVASDRLRREAAALGLSWHPNVVEILDEGHLPDGTCFLVMERLAGESLETRLARTGTLARQELLPIALQLCDALGAVHAAGVVHRDLKPSNVFLVDDGQVVKLLDFGVARVEWAEPRLTLSGVPLGTHGYMSPEQESGLEIDGRSDLYALGALLYRCLTGQEPTDRLAQALRTGSDDSGVHRLVPEDLAAIIQRATAPLVRDRYADAREMRSALTAVATEAQRPGARLNTT